MDNIPHSELQVCGISEYVLNIKFSFKLNANAYIGVAVAPAVGTVNADDGMLTFTVNELYDLTK